MKKRKIATWLLMIIDLSIIFLAGAGCTGSCSTQTVFQANYVESGAVKDEKEQEKLINTLYSYDGGDNCPTVVDDDKMQKAISVNPNTPETFKHTEGYESICGIFTSGNGVGISGNVKVYGGVYTRGCLYMGNGAIINVDNSYINRIAKDIGGNNPKVFKNAPSNGSDGSNYQKPFDVTHLPRKVRLMNIREEPVESNIK